jgi:hypothetical protein
MAGRRRCSRGRGHSSTTGTPPDWVYVFNISNAQSYRVMYMDGRGHPANLTRNYFGHSTGRWEGDTLVIDTVGFSERFWMNRDGLPHTSQLHLIERLTRVDFDNWNYLTSAIVP